MKKIGVVIASIAGIAGLIGVGWSLFNNSNEFIGFVTQQSTSKYYCKSTLPGDPGLKEWLTTNNPTTKNDVKKTIENYLQEVGVDRCEQPYNYKKDSFGHQKQTYNNKGKKRTTWGCTFTTTSKPSVTYTKTCIIDW